LRIEKITERIPDNKIKLYMNQTIFQFFHWYYSTEGNLWNHACDQAGHLASLGVSQVWLPPAYKSARGAGEPGYAVYDLYDLGEFDQKGTVRTRYGTREEYLHCIRSFHDAGIKVLADIVLNHKHGGDEKENIKIKRVNPNNRREFVSGDETIEVFTRFTFPGRQGKYSQYVWDQHSFTGVQLDDGIGMIQNEYSNGQWEEMLENELGNFDFLMGNDIEYRNPAVREELKNWGRWYVETTGIDGFRLDALKHINPGFYPEWLGFLNEQFKKKFLCIGEYWQNNVGALLTYIDVTRGAIQLFDVPLHFNFQQASTRKKEYDIRKIFDNTLLKERPELSITFVDNHDTQPLQSLESTVDYWFKPLAYAIILLREQGTPCVFYPAVYEAKYTDHKDGKEIYVELNKVPGIEEMMKVRAKLAYGQQHDYFDHEHVAGWTREGSGEYPGSGCAVVISNGDGGEKKMYMGKQHAGKKMKPVCGNPGEIIELDKNGDGLFKVNETSAAVWVMEDAQI
jgi:alpha-amylase